MQNDYDSDYETLLKISETPTMQMRRIKQLAIEIFKTNVNNLNLNFMKYIFTSKQDAWLRPHDLLVRSHKTVTYSDKSLKILGPKIWNALPTEIKHEISLSEFKEYVKSLPGHSCKWNLLGFELTSFDLGNIHFSFFMTQFFPPSLKIMIPKHNIKRKNNFFLNINHREKLSFAEFITGIYWNRSLIASVLFFLFTQSNKVYKFHWHMLRKVLFTR